MRPSYTCPVCGKRRFIQGITVESRDAVKRRLIKECKATGHDPGDLIYRVGVAPFPRVSDQSPQ